MTASIDLDSYGFRVAKRHSKTGEPTQFFIMIRPGTRVYIKRCLREGRPSWRVEWTKGYRKTGWPDLGKRYFTIESVAKSWILINRAKFPNAVKLRKAKFNA